MRLEEKSGHLKSDRKIEKSLLEREFHLIPQTISDKEKELIYRQLAVLQSSGVDFRSSFQLLIDQVKKKTTRSKLNDVLNEIIKGKSLSESMKLKADFSIYEIFTVKIGEETGKLTIVLQKLSEYYQNKLAQRRQIVSAFSYPILILLTSLGAVSFMIFFIIPMFQEVFKRFNGQLPSLTQTIINLAEIFKQWVPIIAMIFIGIVIVFWVVRKRPIVQMMQEALILRIPLIGQIYKEVYLARFSDTMGLLIQSNVPMIHTLDMVKKMIGMQHISRVLSQISQDLVHGKGIAESFAKYPLFDKQMLALIKVGEEVNKLGAFFEKLGVDYTNSVKHKTGMLATFMEPLLIVFLGLVVGIILVAMYLPMFELSSSMNFGN